MKKFLFFAALLCISDFLLAQDLIIFRNGDELLAKVSEINPTEVKYHRYDNPNGPLYVISKKDIFMIKYENGTKDVINDLSVQPTTGQPQTNATAKHRYPGLAFLYSALLPGGGQYYNHQFGKGAAMSALWIGGIITTAVAADRYSNCYYDYNGNWVCDYYNYDNDAEPAAVVGGFAIAGSWIWSVIDAPINAARINKTNGATGLLEFKKKDKFSLRIDPFNSPGLGGSLSMRF